jgi:hypothetical protein
MPRHKTHIGMRGHFKRAGVPCKKFVKEFEVSEDAHLPLGTLIHELISSRMLVDSTRLF